jgi:hypothetical protein
MSTVPFTPDAGFSFTDSQTDPEGASRAVAEAFESGPELPDSPETSGTLLLGYTSPTDGAVLRDFEIRELTGVAEERLAKVLAKRSSGATNIPFVYRTILEEGLVSIGGRPLDEHMARNLLVGDRDYLLMKIRIATYGADYEATIVCPKCGIEQGAVFELAEGEDGKTTEHNDVPYRRPTDMETVYSVKLRHGRTARVRMLSVEDQVEALKDATLTFAERNTLLVSRMVLDIGGVPMLGLSMAQQLSGGDRKILEKEVNDRRFGPQLEEVVLVCAHCKEESEMSMNMTSLFL